MPNIHLFVEKAATQLLPGGPHVITPLTSYAMKRSSCRTEAPSLLFGSYIPTPFSTIHHAFRYHAITQPDTVAVEHLGDSLTYRELDLVSHHMASRLRRLGVIGGDHVCLLMKRGVPMVACILAVLKCGGVYVPLDGGVTSDATLEHVLTDSAACVVVASEFCLSRVASRGRATVLCMEEFFEECRTTIATAKKPVLTDNVTGDNGAYIIYTSGTTGKPKGVLVTHKNVTNLLCLPPGNLGMRSGMRVAQLLNVAFDMCVWEVLGSLLNGCTLCLRGSQKQSWGTILSTVDVVISTPSILATYEPSQYPNIKVVATAGEPCPQSFADKWAAHARFFNCCGPTETTIVNTVSQHVPGGPISIGRPTPNNAVYILDADLHPVPAGSVGVMWAGGAGISQGYVNLLTAVRYMPDPFLCRGGHMFNTGDLGRLLPDGQLEYLGRVDDQVKVKGFRIELDGIQAVLCNNKQVSSAACLMVKGEIVAFISPAAVDIEQIKSEMSFFLPYYAVPTRILRLAELPLTTNGKIDKSALRAVAALG